MMGKIRVLLVTVFFLSELGVGRIWCIRLCNGEEVGHSSRWHPNTYIDCLSKESREAWWVWSIITLRVWFIRGNSLFYWSNCSHLSSKPLCCLLEENMSQKMGKDYGLALASEFTWMFSKNWIVCTRKLWSYNIVPT